MSDKYSKLIQVMKVALLPDEVQPLFTAEVKEITGDTCTILYGELELTDVRLKVTIDDNVKTMILQPKVGSMVLVGSLTGDLKDLAVIKIDELDKIILDVAVAVDVTSPKVKVTSDEVTIKGGKIIVDAEAITINGGDNMGLAKVQSIAGRLNLLEQDLTIAKAAFTAWVPIPMDGGLALKTAIASWAAAALAPTVASQLENKTIKH